MANATHNQRGMILVVVLWVVAMMTAIIVALSAFTQKNLSLASAEAEQLRSEQLLYSGLEAAKASILATSPENRVFLDGERKRINLGNGNIVEVSAQDTAGLIDVNRTPIAVLESLANVIAPGNIEAVPLIHEIIRLRNMPEPKSESKPKEKTGTEQVKPVILSTAGELRALAGGSAMNITEFLKLATFHTVDGKINPFAAPDNALLAVPGLKLGDIAIFKSAKSQKRWQQPQVENALAKYGDFLAAHESRIFNIEVTIVTDHDSPSGRKLAATVILDQEADVPFQTLSLSW